MPVLDQVDDAASCYATKYSEKGYNKLHNLARKMLVLPKTEQLVTNAKERPQLKLHGCNH